MPLNQSKSLLVKILKLSLYRFDPEKDDRPYMSDHSIKMEGHGNMMVIDAIRKAQERSNNHL